MPTSSDKPSTDPTLSKPGRSCPLHYRYEPTVFNQPAAASSTGLEVLYVVGGLYGNTLALTTIQAMFAAETGRKQMVFNGDFHWFDANAELFDRIDAGVHQHVALRGNVETEIASDSTEAGCGCAYPEWVGDDVVEHSNAILQRLRQSASAAARQRLGALPMWHLASLADQRIAIVHGDAQSLAGWGFAQEHLQDPLHCQTVAAWFDFAQVDIFASTHTCLPVMQCIAQAPKPRWVINNGAAGMPNFRGDGTGLLTRIALSPAPQGLSRAGVRVGALYIDLLAVPFDQTQWQASFLDQWPAGSHAHQSYWTRIVDGPNYQRAQVMRTTSKESTC